MNKTEEKLQNMIDELGEEYRIYYNYSGRFMFGATCLGIVGPDPTAIIGLAKKYNLRGARQDNLGLEYIVYWPDLKESAKGDPMTKIIRDEDEKYPLPKEPTDPVMKMRWPLVDRAKELGVSGIMYLDEDLLRDKIREKEEQLQVLKQQVSSEIYLTRDQVDSFIYAYGKQLLRQLLKGGVIFDNKITNWEEVRQWINESSMRMMRKF